jgi:hypothetical protein
VFAIFSTALPLLKKVSKQQEENSIQPVRYMAFNIFLHICRKYFAIICLSLRPISIFMCVMIKFLRK